MKEEEIKEEIKEEIREQIGFLRQWLNERTSKKLITDKEIKTFLNL